MNKKILLLFFMLLGYGLFGQGIRDTIEVGRNFKSALFFSEDIADSFMGNEVNFGIVTPKNSGSKFNYQMIKLYYEVLAVEKKNFTNLTVVTKSGNVYEFIIKLTDHPKQLNWPIPSNMAVFNVEKDINSLEELKKQKDLSSPLIADDNSNLESLISQSYKGIEEQPIDSVLKLTTSNLYKNDPKAYYRSRCYYMQFDKARIPCYFARKDDVFLWLKGVYYNNNELYVQLKIQNKEEIDLDLNFIKYFIESSYKKTTKQKIPITKESGLLYEFKVPKTVKGFTENHFVLVFKKFTLDNKKSLLIELDEDSGNRNLSLRIGKDILNKPIRF